MSESSRAELEAQRDKLHHSLAGLDGLDLPAVAEMQAQIQAQPEAIETRLATLQDDTSAPTFDQQTQQVNTQVNIAHLYQVYENSPGRAQLNESEFKKALANYLDWVRREYGFSRLHGLQTLQDTGPLNKPLAQVYTSLAVYQRPAVPPGGEGGNPGDWATHPRIEWRWPMKNG